jgi:hypothetical protein
MWRRDGGSSCGATRPIAHGVRSHSRNLAMSGSHAYLVRTWTVQRRLLAAIGRPCASGPKPDCSRTWQFYHYP